MDAQTLIVEEECSLGSVDEQNVSDISSAETLLDSTSTNADDVDLQYQFRANEGGECQDSWSITSSYRLKLMSVNVRGFFEKYIKRSEVLLEMGRKR